MAERTGRTTATVVFTDMVGSSALRSRLGEERADELRGIHDTLLAARVKAAGGLVIRGQGDGLVAAFAAASVALAAAVEMQQAVDAHNRRHDALAQISVRIGLSTGDVSWEGGDCFGTPMVEAARLEAAAEGGQILCSDYVRMMARGRGGHEFRRVGLLNLKGLPEPLAVSEVVWTPGPEPGGMPLPSELAVRAARPFVSRRAELELADGILGDRGRSRAAVLWVLGEPGIGKTRLATEIARLAHDGGALVLFGRCSEDLPVPYQPFLEALRWFLEHVPGDQLPARLGAFAGELTRLVPELGERVRGLEASRSASPEIEQHRLFEALRSWLAAAGADRPVLAVLDDVQWADRSTLALLGHITRSAERSRALLVCTARNTSPDDNPALAALAEELERRAAPGHRVELAGLGVEDVGELVSRATGRALDDRLRITARQLQAETAGNPLYVDALLANLPAGGGRPEGEIPRTLSETVGRRVGRLPREVGDLLRVAAVEGLDFDLRVTARAARRDELASLELLEGAVRAALVEEPAPNRYRFAHALVRAALREELSQSRRARVHLAVGEAIEAVFGDHLDEHVPALAHHFFEAVPAGGLAKAYRYAVLAGERATRLLSHHEAVQGYGRALELLDQVKGESAVTRCELLLARGQAEARAGDVGAALETLRETAGEASLQGSPEYLGQAAVAYESTGFTIGSPGPAAVDLLRCAEAALPRANSRLRALTLASLGRALLFAGNRAEAMDRGRDALAIARSLEDDATTGAVLVRASFPYMTPENAHLMAVSCRELIDVAARVGDEVLRGWAVFFSLHSAGQLGEAARVDELLIELGRCVEQVHQPIWTFDLVLIRHVWALVRGELDLAEQLLEEAGELDRAFGWGLEGVYAMGMFLLRREQGRLRGVLPMIRVLVRTSPEAALWRPGLALLYAELDLLDDARTEFDRLAGSEFAALAAKGNFMFLSLLAEVCCALKDEEHAAWFLEQLRPCEGRLLLWQVACLGPADRLLGKLASVAGRIADAERWHARALELSRCMGSPLWTAHCLHDYADHLWIGDPARARTMMVEAAGLCQRYHLTGLGQRLRAGWE